MRVPLAVAALTLGVVTGVSARTRPNVDGSVVLGVDGPRGAASAAAMPSHRAGGTAEWARAGSGASSGMAAIVPAALPVGAEQVDSTYYDHQDFGSLGARIVIDANGNVHVTYEKDYCEIAGSCPPNPNAPDPYPWRGMGYAMRDAVGWTHVGKVQDPRLNCTQCVPEHVGGFGTISLTSTGLAVISQHMNEDGCARRGDMYLEDAPGAASWRGYLTPIPGAGDPPYLEFPQAVANPNGSYTVIAESPRAGLYDEVEAFRATYLSVAGSFFTCPLGWQFGTWTAPYTPSMFKDGRPAFPSLAVSSNGRVGIAAGDFGGNVYLIESSNGSFAAGTITTRNLTNYVDATITSPDSTSTQYRPYIHCHLAYNDTIPNVVWSELQARKAGSSTLVYHDFRSRIMHWDPVRGVEVVKQVLAGEADHYDDVDQGLTGPLAGLNHITVDWPQVGFSADGLETYVAWLRFVDAEVDPTADTGLPGIVTGVGFGDIAASLTRPGEAWSAPQNLTNTPDTDERFFSLAQRNTGGRAHIVFQASATNQAGNVIFGDRGTNSPILLRRIAYLERPMTASLVSVPDDPDTRLEARTLLVAPNPAGSRVRFSPRGGVVAAGTAVEVFGVNGRRVAHLSADRDGSFTWDGREPGGQRASAGIYFARVVAHPARGAATPPAVTRPVRFTLLP